MNGERATIGKSYTILDVEFTPKELIMKKINKYDFITFDFFDTLFLRQCFSLDDIFLLIEKRILSEGHAAEKFAQMRHKAASELHGKNSTIDEIYKQIEKYSIYRKGELDYFKKVELEIQKKLLIPRYNMIDLLKYVMSLGKKVKIVSDMYLPASFLQECLNDVGADVDNIYVSCELKCRKADGTIWKRINIECPFEDMLHFGDNLNGDVNIPKNLGISMVYVPNVRNIADTRGFTKIAGEIKNLYESVLYALVINRLFNSGTSKGSIICNRDMGYCVFGPLFLTYLLWLIKEKIKHGH